MQADRRELARSWLSGARQDLEIAIDGAARWPNAACFHAQQAAEKALKALLVALAGDVARTHALIALAAELAEAGCVLDASTIEACKVLDKFYAPTRYPDALGGVDPTMVFTEREASGAVDHARVVIDFVRVQLAIDPSSYP